MLLVLNSNRGSVYSERMKIEVPERYSLTKNIITKGINDSC